MAWSKEEGRRYWEENKDKYNSIRREKWKNDPEFRSAESKRRKTKDGRTCGETTTWDGVSYIGCTKAPTPDGE